MTKAGYLELASYVFKSKEQVEDPLIIHDADDKSPELSRAIDYLKSKQLVFKPLTLTNPTSKLEGHGQTILSEIKDEYFNLYFPQLFEFKYTKEEIYTFKDGGQTKICYKVNEKERNTRDWIFFFSGQVGCDQSIYLKNMMKEAYEKRGYNVCMISWRGQSGVPLVTPQLYNAFSIDDETALSISGDNSTVERVLLWCSDVS